MSDAGPDPGDVALWDQEAETFDEAADHGLADPAVRRAWEDLLTDVLPAPPARVADLGCGTGTLSVLLARQGHEVHGVDFSPEMVSRARAKAARAPDGPGPRPRFAVADAAEPPLPAASYDVVLCRHVLWAMPDPAGALARWIALLVPGGRLVLVEGRWANEAGLTAAEAVALVEATGREAALVELRGPAYWGRETGDERYLLLSGA